MCSQHHQISCPAVAVSVTRLGDVEPSSIQQKKKSSVFVLYILQSGAKGAGDESVGYNGCINPDVKMVESKSLKLYLFGFRSHGDFHEDCVNTYMEAVSAAPKASL